MKTITREELKKLYNENTNKKAAEVLGVSIVTLLKMLDDNGIEKKGPGNRTLRPKVQVVG